MEKSAYQADGARLSTSVSEEGGMSTTTVDFRAQVVRGAGDRVVVIFWGRDAPAEAAEWAGRGYRVDTVDRGLLGH
jgi:hypothetical protein